MAAWRWHWKEAATQWNLDDTLFTDDLSQGSQWRVATFISRWRKHYFLWFYIFLVKYKYNMYISVQIPRCWLPASKDSVKYLKYENKYILRSKYEVVFSFLNSEDNSWTLKVHSKTLINLRNWTFFFFDVNARMNGARITNYL